MREAPQSVNNEGNGGRQLKLADEARFALSVRATLITAAIYAD